MQQTPTSYDLVIFNIAKAVTKDDLQELFKKAGPIHHVVIRSNEIHAYNMGFVGYNIKEDCDKGLSMYNDYEWNGTKLRVDYARIRPPRPFTSGGHTSDEMSGQRRSPRKSEPSNFRGSGFRQNNDATMTSPGGIMPSPGTTMGLGRGCRKFTRGLGGQGDRPGVERVVIPKREMEMNKPFPVLIPEFSSANKFPVLVNVPEVLDDYRTLATMIASADPEKQASLTSLPPTDTCCLAKWAMDEGWYRVDVVEAPLGGRQARVLFVDEGNEDTVELTAMRAIEVEKLKTLPRISIQCSLGEETSKELVNFVDEAIKPQENIQVIFTGEKEGKKIIKLMVNDVDLLESYQKTKAPPLVSLPPPSLAPGSSVELTVIQPYYTNACEFICQLETVPDLDALVASSANPSLTASPVPKMVVCVGPWDLPEVTTARYHRGEVAGVDTSKKTATVRLVDYCDSAVVGWNFLHPLPEQACRTPIVGLLCCVEGASAETEERWQEFFTGRVDSENQLMFTAQVRSHDAVSDLYTLHIDQSRQKPIRTTEVAAQPITSNAVVVLTNGHAERSSFETKGYIVVADDPHRFFVIKEEDAEKVSALNEKLREQFDGSSNTRPLLMNAPELAIGSMVAGESVQFGGWSRVKVLALKKRTNEVEVRFMDFGNVETLPLANLRRLTPDYLDVKPYATECRLAGIYPCQGDTFSETETTTFKKLVNVDEPALCNVTVHPVTDDGACHVTVEHPTEGDLARRLLTLGMAISEKKAPSPKKAAAAAAAPRPPVTTNGGTPTPEQLLETIQRLEDRVAFLEGIVYKHFPQ